MFTKFRPGRFPALLCTILALTGCATLDDHFDAVRDFAKAHPVAIAVGTAVVVGAVIASTHGHENHQRLVRVSPGAPCEMRQSCAP
jgi:hypothetical protein